MTTNNWQEFDGIEVDLSSLPLAPREFSMKFEFAGPYINVNGFVECLGAKSITFNSVEAGIQRTLRCLGYSSYAKYDRGSSVTVRFVEDSPSVLNPTLPTHTIPTDNRFKLDGVPFSDFNVRILKGSEASAICPSDNKQYLTRASKFTTGQTYDEGGYKVMKERNVTLQCLLTASSLSEFYKFYNGLFHKLVYENSSVSDPTLACERELSVSVNNASHKCFFKGQSVNAFAPFGSNKIWCQFGLTLCVLNDTLYFFDLLLAAENDYLVITEDGKLIKV